MTQGISRTRGKLSTTPAQGSRPPPLDVQQISPLFLFRTPTFHLNIHDDHNDDAHETLHLLIMRSGTPIGPLLQTVFEARIREAYYD